jgi:hypothetical protein
MASNTNIQLSDLDFNTIKSNFITYLQGQDTLKDYDYTGSALSVLLDILAYNTQYNAFYLNMVANEMFLDSAIQRSSVVSHAKMLNYTPRSAICPTAFVSMNVYNVVDSSLTMPKYTKFVSDAIDGVNYTFLTVDDMTVNIDVANTSVAVFNNFELKQGVVVNNSFTVDTTANPSLTFDLPDENIDTTTLIVSVQQSTSNTNYNIFTLATDYTALTSNSYVYFLQEGKNGFYEIYFGDNNLGRILTDGNIVNVSWLSTKGMAATGANSFTLIDTIGNYGQTIVTPVASATQGNDRESIDSIKFQAPKAYASQSRAVTIDDYITVIKQNKYGIPIDAVNVWSGDTATPQKFGAIYAAVKPSGGYSLTNAQKLILIDKVIKPVSVLTITPELVTPDYIYLLFTANVQFDSKKTFLTSQQIKVMVKQGVIDFCNSTLNSFNSTFSVGDLIAYIQNLDKSITGVDFDLSLQKRLLVTLNSAQTYDVKFNNPLQLYASQSVNFPDTFSQYDVNGTYYPEVYFEESIAGLTSVSSVVITAAGSGYVSPVVSILGDGTGATAVANVTSGIITGVQVTNPGTGYSQAIINITDPAGTGANAIPVITKDFTTLRTYYFKDSIKTILTTSDSRGNAGTIDYAKGIVSLTNFIPTTINNTNGYFRVNARSAERFISSTYEQIITLDSNDPAAVVVNVTTR